jgi:hypothetical protein
MGKRNHSDKGRLPSFTPVLHGTMDTPAWRALSHGAARLYLSLKRRVPKQKNMAWLSVRNAKREIKASPRKIQEWFAELQHYGFIVLHKPHCLGSEGKGKSPTYRLTELGVTSAASPNGELEPPTRSYLRWDGTIFKPKRRRNTADGSKRVLHLRFKKQNPVHPVVHRVCTPSETPLCTTSETPKPEGVHPGGYIENTPDCAPHGQHN